MASMTRRVWRHTLLRLAAWLSSWLIVGLLVGAPWPALAIGLATALAWQYRQWHRLLRYLDRRHRTPAPRGDGVVAAVLDRLDRRRHQQRRRTRRLLGLLRAFRQAAAALPDGVLVLGPELEIEWFNPAAAELLGLADPRDVGLRLPNLLRAPRVAEWLGAGGGEPLFDQPSPVDPARRLSLRLIDYTARQQLLVVRDVSKLMQLEQVRRDFVANVSHELRTPLTVIHGYLDLLDPEPGSDWVAPVNEMRRQSQRMTQLVEDLLTLSRLEARDSLPAEPVPMARLLNTLLREGNALSGGQHRVTLEDTADCDLLGAEQELHSAFSNLVANAVRYTPYGGNVVIRFLRTADSGAVFEVEDSGPGIPSEHLARLTERFYRVSSSRARSSGGTGLGLAIVKHVLHLHQARLEIDSAPGRGSRFAAVFDAGHACERMP
jgi:two-component system, OmpR family, phosphate regulon sensor histidine kinase PhoR